MWGCTCKRNSCIDLKPFSSIPPSLFYILKGCVGAPATTNLRTCAKKKVLQSKESTISNEGDEDPNQRILSLPVSFRTVADVFLENQDVLLKEFASDPGIPFHIKVLTEYRQQYAQGFLDEEQIVVFRDDNVESELVYGIMVNQ